MDVLGEREISECGKFPDDFELSSCRTSFVNVTNTSAKCLRALIRSIFSNLIDQLAYKWVSIQLWNVRASRILHDDFQVGREKIDVTRYHKYLAAVLNGPKYYIPFDIEIV